MNMKKIELHDQKKTGLFPVRKRIEPPTFENVRCTIPAREALEAVGATVVPELAETGVLTYSVTMGTSVPAGLLAVAIDEPDGYGYREILSLRLSNDPPYPGEHEADYWRRLDFTPCPRCGAPLLWYEAGYVPGYRVCSKKPHHHILAR